MPDSNPLIDSVLAMTMISVRHEFELCYDQVKKQLGDEFNNIMELLSHDILGLQKEIKKDGTDLNVIQVTMCMVMQELDDSTPEERQRLDKFLKACSIWILENKIGE